MEKLIKLNKLFYIVIGYEKGLSSNTDSQLIPNLEPLIVHAKYQFFHRGRIKYFINRIDKTKYYPEGRVYGSNLCAIHYIPVTSIIYKSEIIRGKYAKQSTIQRGAIQYSEMISKEEAENNSINNSSANNSTENKNNLDPTFGTILTDKYYLDEPIVGRKKEIENLIICLADKEFNPLLVGPPGVGKTSMVDELAYLIKTNKVPDFLKGREIIEVHASELVSGTMYRGTLEEKVSALIDYVEQKKAILFIDEIHTIYGAGETITGNLDVAEMLKHAISRKGVDIIGITTSEKYAECMSQSNLKNSFESITIEEPNSSLLYEIICQKLDYYAKFYNIATDNIDRRIIDILIELTDVKHRKYNDKVCNPTLVVGIISRAFARAAAENRPNLTYDDIIASIEGNNRIYSSAGVDAIKKISHLMTAESEESRPKILRLHR